jgi:predicted nuclease with TOPRIM domain
MHDDSSHSAPKSTLRSEWTFLLESFVEENIEPAQAKVVQGLPLDFIQDQMRDMSEQKHQLFQKIESIKAEIEETQVVIENLQLVGSDTQEALERIDELQEQGSQLTEQVQNLDKKIKKIRTLAG